MFDDQAPLTTSDLTVLVGALAHLAPAAGDADRVDRLRVLEELKSAAAAAQARETADFVTSQENAQADAGVKAKERGKGIAAQVALATRQSPARASRYVGWSRILVAELPHTFAALQAGRITEWRAQIVARETAWLDREHRSEVDATLAPHLEAWGDRRVEAETKKHAYRLDPRGYLARISGVAADRRVTLRPAPDTMALLTGFLPVAQGVAAFAALQRHADGLRAGGDPRSRGQIMADTLVERVTGQASAEAVPVEVHLVMTDRALLGDGRAARGTDQTASDGGEEPAHLQGYGPVPAALARQLAQAAAAGEPGAEAAGLWLRRLWSDPAGRLVAMESGRRLFPGLLARFLTLRDQTCRTPWCDAPVRHADHVVPAAEGGPTAAANGQGLCEACNHAKDAPGWRARPDPGGGSGAAVHTTTPTGHTYVSEPPDPPGREAARPPTGTGDPPDPSDPSGDPRGEPTSPLEAHFRALIDAA